MKRLIFILACALAGCVQDLTPPLNSVLVTSMADYFWHPGSSLEFNSDHIATRDSLGILLANDSTPAGTLRTTLKCLVSSDSVFAEGFTTGSILDLGKDTSFITLGANGSRHSGGILLLKANPLVDSSWNAGILMTGPSYKSDSIEARLLARLDTVTISGVKYPDVLAIRYANEVPPSYTVDSLNCPYWVIYYARGRGPIMFDKVQGSSFERRALLP